MSINNSFGRASFLFALLAAAACGDDGDDTGSDEQVQSSSSDDTSSRNTTRAGSSATTRTARGGSSSSSTAGATSSDAAGAGPSQGTRRGAAGSGSPGTAGRRGLPPGAAGTGAAGTGTPGTAGTGAAGIGAADDAGVGMIVLSDGQIADFASAANAGEITLGMVAVTRAQLPAVRDFGQTMISGHNTAQARQTAIVNSLGITTSTSPLSEQLSENAAAVLKQLQNASVADFDILYIRSQVDMHLQVLQALDEHLLPNVSAEALRSELMLTRTEAQAHLESARALLTMLDGIDVSDAGVP